MFEFEFFEPEEDYGVVKATVHKTGKLGFSSGAGKKFDFEVNRYYKIGRNKADKEDKALYMLNSSEEDKSSYKVSKAGDYYYLRIKNIIDSLGYDYLNESVIFNIQEVESGESKYYKLIRRT
ncbi:MAG: hypothetical protein V4619_16660 [Bacteroidota bacterium]